VKTKYENVVERRYENVVERRYENVAKGTIVLEIKRRLKTRRTKKLWSINCR
jgi:hypothetical protein